MAKFKCPKCPRSFSMPAHLGRHVKAMHGPGRKKAVAKRRAKGKRRGPGRPPGRPPKQGPDVALSGISPDRVIKEMQAYRGALVSQRDSLDAQISSIEGALKEMGAPTGERWGGRRGPGAGVRRARRGPGRPRGGGFRPGSMKDSIVTVLRNASGAMTPGEIAAAVKASGYKTKSADLTKAVSNALSGLKAVKKAGRGLYRI